MSFDAKDQEREFILECLQVYHELPALWDQSSEDYRNRFMKNKAYECLLQKYRERYPKATKTDLRNKINTLRTNYNKELKKSMRMGPDYKPSLWYFNEISFVKNQEFYASDSFPASSSSTSKLSNDEQQFPVKQDTNTAIARPSLKSTTSRSSYSEATRYDRIASKSAFKKPKNDDGYEDLGDRKDEYYYWAQACAADLRKMERTQQLYAKKAVADILVEGQLGLLHRNSVKVNETPQPQFVEYSNRSSPDVKQSMSPEFLEDPESP